MYDTFSMKSQLERKKIIAICRRIYGEDLLHLAGALHEGGVDFIEVTFDQAAPDCLEKTAQAIKMLAKSYKDMYIGAGTVLTYPQVDAATAAGAGFIISPNTDIEIIKYTKKCGLVSIPGAMTPSEIIAAHNAGADYVKLFPCAYLGERYIKDIMAPISHVKLIATGGVNADNFQTFMDFGMVGAGISGALSDKAAIRSGDWEKLKRNAQALTALTQPIL